MLRIHLLGHIRKAVKASSYICIVKNVKCDGRQFVLTLHIAKVVPQTTCGNPMTTLLAPVIMRLLAAPLRHRISIAVAPEIRAEFPMCVAYHPEGTGNKDPKAVAKLFAFQCRSSVVKALQVLLRAHERNGRGGRAHAHDCPLGMMHIHINQPKRTRGQHMSSQSSHAQCRHAST
eukprot:5367452-Pleurochrysis_carterae.AAC.1